MWAGPRTRPFNGQWFREGERSDHKQTRQPWSQTSRIFSRLGLEPETLCAMAEAHQRGVCAGVTADPSQKQQQQQHFSQQQLRQQQQQILHHQQLILQQEERLLHHPQHHSRSHSPVPSQLSYLNQQPQQQPSQPHEGQQQQQQQHPSDLSGNDVAAILQENSSLLTVIEGQQTSLATLRRRATLAEREVQRLEEELAILKDALEVSEEQVEALVQKEQEVEAELQAHLRAECWSAADSHEDLQMPEWWSDRSSALAEQVEDKYADDQQESFGAVGHHRLPSRADERFGCHMDEPSHVDADHWSVEERPVSHGVWTSQVALPASRSCAVPPSTSSGSHSHLTEDQSCKEAEAGYLRQLIEQQQQLLKRILDQKVVTRMRRAKASKEGVPRRSAAAAAASHVGAGCEAAKSGKKKLVSFSLASAPGSRRRRSLTLAKGREDREHSASAAAARRDARETRAAVCRRGKVDTEVGNAWAIQPTTAAAGVTLGCLASACAAAAATYCFLNRRMY